MNNLSSKPKPIVKMLKQRCLQLVFVVFGIGTLTFLFSRQLSGDMAYRIAASRYGEDMVDSAAANLVRQELGLDAPWWQQYLNWMQDLLQFDFGNSWVSGEPVLYLLQHELGMSVALALLALSFSLTIGCLTGVLVGLSKKRWPELLSLGSALFIRSLPVFAVGVILILIFSVYWNWLPVAGHGHWTHIILPSASLALGLSVLSMRMSTHCIREVTHTAYYRYGALKGLSPYQNFLQHGLRNITAPLIAYHSIQLIYLLEGVVVVESLFAWPGIGHALTHAIFDRDIPVLQATSITIGVGFVLLNMLIDLLNHAVDPRQQLH